MEEALRELFTELIDGNMCSVEGDGLIIRFINEHLRDKPVENKMAEITKDFLKGTKIKVTPEQSEQVQKLAFGLGFKWADGSIEVSHTERPFMYLENSFRILADEECSDSFFERYPVTEIQFSDLFPGKQPAQMEQEGHEHTAPFIIEACDEIKELLLHKNRMYGNAAINPINIFSKASAEDYLNQQIDLKLSRIKNQQPDESEDTEQDLIGYLILKRVNKKLNESK